MLLVEIFIIRQITVPMKLEKTSEATTKPNPPHYAHSWNP